MGFILEPGSSQGFFLIIPQGALALHLACLLFVQTSSSLKLLGDIVAEKCYKNKNGFELSFSILEEKFL